VRAPAWSASCTRRLGIGDLGLRAFHGIGRVCRTLLARERFDALFITVYPVYPALLGRSLKRRFDLPFVLDFQDPWVGAWGATVGGGPGGSPDWKSRASRQLGEWLEPRAVGAADALVAVSQGTIDGIVERNPCAARVPHAVIPLGFEAADFERLRVTPRPMRYFDPRDGHVHVCYVGTVLPTGIGTVRLLLDGLKRARDSRPDGGRLRLHFFGTSNQSSSDQYRVLPLARERGVDDVITEIPGRLDYLDALSVLTQASGILLLGSSERHYTASKLYPALLAKRPILALFHEASSVVQILGDTGREPTVRVVTYGDGPPNEAHVTAVADHLQALAERPAYRPEDVNLDRASGVSAPALARQLGALLDLVAA